MLPVVAVAAEPSVPEMGPGYHGPRCVAVVGNVDVPLEGAPAGVGDGLRQMLLTALFESNRFLVVDRRADAGLTAEQLLGDAFLDDADAVLAAGTVEPAQVIVSGALVDVTGEGFGLRVNVPAAPLTVGGGFAETRVVLLLQATHAATGKVLVVERVEGSASSARGSVGMSLAHVPLPVQLEGVRNTPLELAFRDCVNRAVVALARKLPPNLFSRPGPGDAPGEDARGR